MKKVYIAARFSRRPECNELARKLQTLGYEITSRWVKPDCDHVLPTGLSQQASDEKRCQFAQEDFEDVKACDTIISLTEEPRSNTRGGRHVEFGMGVALEKRLVVIGPQETVFHHLPDILVFHTTDHFIEHLVDHKEWFE